MYGFTFPSHEEFTQIATLLAPCYTTFQDQLREIETTFCHSSELYAPRESMARRGSIKHSRCVRVSKAKTHRDQVSPAAGSPSAAALTGRTPKG